MTLDLSGVPMWRPDDCWELPIRVSIPRSVTALAFPASNAVRVGTRVSSASLDALRETLLDQGVDLDHATIVRDDRPYDPGMRAVSWHPARIAGGVLWSLVSYYPSMREDTGAWTWRKEGGVPGVLKHTQRLAPSAEMHAAAEEYARATPSTFTLYDNAIRAGREVNNQQEQA